MGTPDPDDYATTRDLVADYYGEYSHSRVCRLNTRMRDYGITPLTGWNTLLWRWGDYLRFKTDHPHGYNRGHKTLARINAGRRAGASTTRPRP